MKKFLCVFVLLLMFVAKVYAKDVRFVQVTDTNYSKETQETFKDLIDTINEQDNVSFVVFTGDNILKPTMENLTGFVKNAKKLKKPFYVVIGDRDVNKHKKLPKKAYTKYLKKNLRSIKTENPNYIFSSNGVMFFVVDGAKDVVPSTNGYFKDDVLEWLDANLDLYSNKNVIILQHFPIIPPIDKEMYATYHADKYLEIINKHKNVKAVISGHYGVNKEQTVNNVVHITTAPAPHFRIIDIIDCDTSTPIIWAEIS